MDQVKRYVATQLRLADRFFDLVLSGKKTSTIRYGLVFFTKDRLLLRSNKQSLPIRLLKLDYSKTFGDLNDEDAYRDGFGTLDELKAELKRFYGDVPSDYPMTVIHFRMEE
jgi:hypothetical protein